MVAAFPEIAALADIASAGRAFPRPAGVTLSYGVAGFRARASLLDSTLLRMGMLAAARSRVAGYAIGLMVTASHNAEPDNGVKLVDADGGMLHQSWEAYAAELANADDDELASVYARILAGVAEAPPAAADTTCEGQQVLIAWDTRPSSERLAALAARGAELGGARASTLGLLTTPQLHHIVRMRNGAAGCPLVGRHYGKGAEWASEGGYYEMLASAYAELVRTGDRGAPVAPAQPIDVDCACGVGAPKVALLNEALAAALGGAPAAPTLVVHNAPGSGVLNDGCGAEHVQKAREPPRGLASPGQMRSGRACSLDGDADRIVFHYFREGRGNDGPAMAAAATAAPPAAAPRANGPVVGPATGRQGAGGEWALLDGDKIAALLADFLGEHLARALQGPAPAGPSPEGEGAGGGSGGGGGSSQDLRSAVVQTAYANGASTAYLRSRSVPLAFAKTGVKFLHHVALDYDLSVYFEANGHGTALFSERLLDRLRALSGGAAGEAAESARVLLACHQLINQAVGDALSDLLVVDAILRRRSWTMAVWDGLYTDLPSRQTKLTVADRTAIRCSEDERRVLQPAELQVALDGLMLGVESGRCFVRPSGTEDAVRIYAEAATQPLADGLALDAARAVHALAGGVGPAPERFAA